MKCIVVLATLASVVGVAFAGVNDRMEFPNKKGTVVFNHRKHEKLVYDECKVCHDGEVGVIQTFGKAFAHRVCIGCHEPEAGKLPGPITCDGCHVMS